MASGFSLPSAQDYLALSTLNTPVLEARRFTLSRGIADGPWPIRQDNFSSGYLFKTFHSQNGAMYVVKIDHFSKSNNHGKGLGAGVGDGAGLGIFRS